MKLNSYYFARISTFAKVYRITRYLHLKTILLHKYLCDCHHEAYLIFYSNCKSQWYFRNTYDMLYMFPNIKVYWGHLTLVILLIHWQLPFLKSFDTSFHFILSMKVLSDVLLKKQIFMKKLNFIRIFTFYLLCFEIGAHKKMCY